LAEIGSEHRQVSLNILTGTVEALKGPNGESVPKTWIRGPRCPTGSQTDPASQLPERTSEVRQAQSFAEFRNKEAVVFGLRKIRRP